MRKIIVLAVIVLFLAGFAWSARTREEQLTNGDTVRVRLAPRDPRAFLLGDYMALNYALNREVDAALGRHAGGQALRQQPRDGVAVVRLDADRVASFVRLDDGQPLRENEHRLYFRVRERGAQIAASAFYFQEGYAADFDRAAYGELRVDAEGRSLLVRLLDDRLQWIQPRRAKPEE